MPENKFSWRGARDKLKSQKKRNRDMLSRLAGKDELSFRRWYGKHAKRLGLNPNPDDTNHYYDYRGAFKSGAEPDESGHWPSKFKIEGHPRMVVDGVNTKTGD